MAGEQLHKKARPVATRFVLIGLVVASLALYLFLTGFGHCSSSPLARLDRPRKPDNGLSFMAGKNVLLVSHELTLTGGPLLLMELAGLLTNASALVRWITINSRDGHEHTKNLELRLQNKGVKIVAPRGKQSVAAALEADVVVLNTAVAGKWIDPVLKSDSERVLPKVLWWIHEMRGHYFTLDYVKHLPKVAGAMIDSYATAEYWKQRTKERLGIQMPVTFVVHLGNSQELMAAAEDDVARDLLRQHVRGALGVADNDIVFAAINSVSRGKGQDLFLKAFFQAVETLESRQGIHALVVGSDWSGQPKFESELREFVKQKRIQHLVHFVNKTLNIVPYLAAADVLVQNSQARGECFGRISIEAMAFKLPVLGTAAGGTREIVVDGVTGYLHPVGKDGVAALASNIVKLSGSKKLRVELGEGGYKRVKERFMEHHMSQKIGKVLDQIIRT